MTLPREVNLMLKELREKSGKTQMEASEWLGHLTAQYISNLERCVCAPSMEMTFKLAKFYKADLKRVTAYVRLSCRRQLERRLEAAERAVCTR